MNSCQPENSYQLIIALDDIQCTTGITEIRNKVNLNYETNSQTLTLKNPNQDLLHLSIYNLSGERVIQQDIFNSHYTKELHFNASGLYLVSVSWIDKPNKKRLVKKIFIR